MFVAAGAQAAPREDLCSGDGAPGPHGKSGAPWQLKSSLTLWPRGLNPSAAILLCTIPQNHPPKTPKLNSFKAEARTSGRSSGAWGSTLKAPGKQPPRRCGDWLRVSQNCHMSPRKNVCFKRSSYINVRAVWSAEAFAWTAQVSPPRKFFVGLRLHVMAVMA